MSAPCLLMCHCEGASRPWQSHAPTSEFAEVALLYTRVLRDCTPRALPRAARSGRHVGLWPPRNDKPLAFTVLSTACPDRRRCAGPGCPLPYIGRCSSAVPSRDCTPRALPRASRSGRHVGLRPPRNDKLGGLAPLNCCCTTCNCLRRSGSAAAAEPSKYPGMHPRKCGKAVAVGGFTKRSKKTSVWVLTKLRLGGIVSLALRGTEC